MGRFGNALLEIMKGLGKYRNNPEKGYSPGSVVLRLGSLFYPPNATSYPEIFTVKQQAKADAANAKTKPLVQVGLI